MKNKIILLTIVLALAITNLCKAQQKPLDLSVKVYGGYGLFTPGSDKFAGYVAYISPNNFDYTQPTIGLGNGLHAGAGIQLNLNQTIAVGLDADFVTGSKHNPASFHDDSTNFNPSSSHSVFSFIPNISFKLWSKPGYSIYNTIGVIVAVKTKVDETNSSSNYAGNTLYHNSDDNSFKYGLNAGLQDAFGVQFNLTKNIKGFAEVTGYFLPVSPTSSTETIRSGTTGSLVVGAVYHMTYKKSGDLDESSSGINNSFNEPLQTQHISSIGINIGVIIAIH